MCEQEEYGASHWQPGGTALNSSQAGRPEAHARAQRGPSTLACNQVLDLPRQQLRLRLLAQARPPAGQEVAAQGGGQVAD